MTWTWRIWFWYQLLCIQVKQAVSHEWLDAKNPFKKDLIFKIAIRKICLTQSKIKPVKYNCRIIDKR